MEKLVRCICPVGQGGFSVETIGDTTVVYDCGSLTSLSQLETYIDCVANKCTKIDYLFLSHFDTDHVNSIGYLLSKIKVCNVVVPLIPDDLKIVFNVYWNGTYTTLKNMFENEDTKIVEVKDQEAYSDKGDLWEWLAKRMMTLSDFTTIRKELKNNNVDINKLDDVKYVETQKQTINNIFKNVFGPQGPNSKGLIVLSQRVVNTDSWQNMIYTGCYGYCKMVYKNIETGNTSCLYVGDANLKKSDLKTLFTRLSDANLGLMQIPHHGSKSNSSGTFVNDFPADLYFVNDKTSKRIQKHNILFTSLSKKKNLLIVRDNLLDCVVSINLKK